MTNIPPVGFVYPYPSTNGLTLAAMLELTPENLSQFHRFDLNKTADFNMLRAEAIAETLQRVPLISKFVILGSKPSQAFGLEWFNLNIEVRLGKQYLMLCHPDGLDDWYDRLSHQERVKVSNIVKEFVYD